MVCVDMILFPVPAFSSLLHWRAAPGVPRGYSDSIVPVKPYIASEPLGRETKARLTSWLEFDLVCESRTSRARFLSSLIKI